MMGLQTRLEDDDDDVNFDYDDGDRDDDDDGACCNLDSQDCVLWNYWWQRDCNKHHGGSVRRGVEVSSDENDGKRLNQITNAHN